MTDYCPICKRPNFDLFAPADGQCKADILDDPDGAHALECLRVALANRDAEIATLKAERLDWYEKAMDRQQTIDIRDVRIGELLVEASGLRASLAAAEDRASSLHSALATIAEAIGKDADDIEDAPWFALLVTERIAGGIQAEDERDEARSALAAAEQRAEGMRAALNNLSDRWHAIGLYAVADSLDTALAAAATPGNGWTCACGAWNHRRNTCRRCGSKPVEATPAAALSPPTAPTTEKP